jgi:S-(hydroxymethyl)glutathione dehydrogenase / alcohol dehydrogenase
MKIEAAILEKKRKIKIMEIIDDGLPKDYVVVKMKYSGICGSQIAEYLGNRGKDNFLPHMLGHEGTGIVYKTGRNVKHLKKGDKVFLTWIKPKNINYKNYTFKKGKKDINSGPVTTFSNFTYVSKYCVHKLPKYLNYKSGVLMGCAFPTGYGMVKNFSKVSNKKILICGIGGVGLSSLIGAIEHKPAEIHIIDKNKKRVDEVLSYIKSRNISYLKKAKKKYYDYIFESTGDIHSLQNTLEYLNDSGKCIFATHPKSKLKIKINPHDLIKGKKIEGCWGGKISYPRDINLIGKSIKKNEKLMRLFFNKSYKFKNIQYAFNEYFKGVSIRPLIKF